MGPMRYKILRLTIIPSSLEDFQIQNIKNNSKERFSLKNHTEMK